MTIRDILAKGKTADIRKIIPRGICAYCGEKIEDEEDEEVGFYGDTLEEWEEYQEQYNGYLDLDEEVEVIEETAKTITANSYYEYDAGDGEFVMTEETGSGSARYIEFCSEECQNDYMWEAHQEEDE